MTQPNEAVGGANDTVVAAEPTLEDRLSAALTEEQPEVEEEPVEAEEGEQPEAAEAEDEIEIEAEEEEELPPINAPVSWSAEEKEEFSKLPREVQETLSKREAQREKFVQTKAQEAAQAREAARTEALRFAEQLKAEAVEQLNHYAQMLEVRPPDARLFAQDPAAYAQQLEIYETAKAQRENAQRKAAQAQAEREQYQAELQKQEAATFHQRLQTELPEAFDPTSGQQFINELAATAQALDYDDDAINRASVEELKALKIAAQWKAKADRYDKAMAKKMERVRAGKSKLPPVSKPGVPSAPGAKANSQYQADREAMKRGDRDAELRVLSRFINN